MDDIGLANALGKFLRLAFIAAIVVIIWLNLTILFIQEDLDAKREGRRWASTTHVAVAWAHWILGLLLLLTIVGALVGLPFLIASVGMRGVHRWGWVFAIMLHSVLVLAIGFALVRTGVTHEVSLLAWTIGVLLLLLHTAVILVSRARLRELPFWRAQQVRENAT